MTNTTQANSLYPVANASTSSSPFVDIFETRDPTSSDVNYSTQKKWLNTVNNNLWMLKGFTSSTGIVEAVWIFLGNGAMGIEAFQVDAFTAPGTDPVVPDLSGIVTITGGQVASGTTNNVIRTDSLAANTYTIEIQRSQAVASSTIGDNGVSHYNSAQFSLDSNAFVSLLSPFSTFHYTLVTTAMSPYTVTSTDFYIATNSTAGPITLNFPNAPSTNRIFIVKDRFGQDAVNNVILTTPGGVVTFDGLTTYTMNSNYQAVNLLFNATSYEVW